MLEPILASFIIPHGHVTAPQNKIEPSVQQLLNSNNIETNGLTIEELDTFQRQAFFAHLEILYTIPPEMLDQYFHDDSIIPEQIEGFKQMAMRNPHDLYRPQLLSNYPNVELLVSRNPLLNTDEQAGLMTNLLMQPQNLAWLEYINRRKPKNFLIIMFPLTSAPGITHPDVPPSTAIRTHLFWGEGTITFTGFSIDALVSSNQPATWSNEIQESLIAASIQEKIESGEFQNYELFRGQSPDGSFARLEYNIFPEILTDTTASMKDGFRTSQTLLGYVPFERRLEKLSKEIYQRNLPELTKQEYDQLVGEMIRQSTQKELWDMFQAFMENHENIIGGESRFFDVVVDYNKQKVFIELKILNDRVNSHLKNEDIINIYKYVAEIYNQPDTRLLYPTSEPAGSYYLPIKTTLMMDENNKPNLEIRFDPSN